MTQVVEPIRAFAHHAVDVGSVLKGVFLPGSINDKVADAYREHLYGDATLQDLPDDPPRFVINATNVQTGSLWRFSKPYMRDYQVGEVSARRCRWRWRWRPRRRFRQCSRRRGCASTRPTSARPGRSLPPPALHPRCLPDRRRVYDNLGLETAWKRYETILVSDAGLAMGADPDQASTGRATPSACSTWSTTRCARCASAR